MKDEHLEILRTLVQLSGIINTKLQSIYDDITDYDNCIVHYIEWNNNNCSLNIIGEGDTLADAVNEIFGQNKANPKNEKYISHSVDENKYDVYTIHWYDYVGWLSGEIL